MIWLWILLGALVALSIAALCLVLIRRDRYVRRESTLTDAENYFYYLLRDLLPHGYELIPQAPLISCLDAKGKKRVSINRILSKRFDYAIVRSTRTNGYPYRRLCTVAVIELDDPSHRYRVRKKRDRFVNRICRAAKLPLLRFPCQSGKAPEYDEEAIRREVLRAIRIGDVFA